MAKSCPSCGFYETDDQSVFCNKCGYPFPRNPPGKVVAAQAPDNRMASPAARKRRPVQKKSGSAGFLSFDMLVTRDYLRPIYIAGAVLVVLVSVMGIAGMFAKPVKGAANISITNTTAIAQDPAGSPLFWIGFLVAGSIFWRMFCELFVVLSQVHNEPGYEEDASAYDESGEYGGEEEAPGWEGTGQMVECPKCQKIVPAEDLRECEHCGVQGCTSCIRSMGLLKKTMTCRECFEAK